MDNEHDFGYKRSIGEVVVDTGLGLSIMALATGASGAIGYETVSKVRDYYDAIAGLNPSIGDLAAPAVLGLICLGIGATLGIYGAKVGINQIQGSSF